MLRRYQIVREAVVQAALQLEQVLGVGKEVGVTLVEVLVRLGRRVGESNWKEAFGRNFSNQNRQSSCGERAAEDDDGEK